MWETVLASVTGMAGVLGGLEAVKYFVNRKQEARRAEAAADTDEFHLMRETIEFLQGQLKEKEVRFSEQTDLVRGLNVEVLTLTRKAAELEIELVKVRCDDEACPFRRPPNAKTPPHPGMTREEWHLEVKSGELRVES